MVTPAFWMEGVFFMQFKEQEQKEQFERLEVCFKNKDYKKLSTMFRTESIKDASVLVKDECYTFFEEIHAHNLESMIVNFTCIYVPPIDKTMYGIKDAKDILEQKQKENTFVLEISMAKCDVTEIRLRTMLTFANYLGMSMYMSVADYKRVKREADNLYGVSSMILDLDTYNSIHECDTDEEMFEAMQPILKRIGVEPNMYINSGHGRYLVFSFNNVNLSVPEMQKLYKETIKKLIFQFKEFGADSKCCDITRIFRLPGNVNPKTGDAAYIIKKFDKRTTLSDLATAIGICKGKDVDEKTQKSKRRTFAMYYKSIFNSKYSKVNQQRDEDFNKLLELRNYGIEGYRNIFFHLMSINCFYLGMDEKEVTIYLKEINKSLVAPYDSLDAIIHYAKNNYELYQEDYDKAIKYTNRNIVKLLDITKEEQKYMLQFIDDGEAGCRREETKQIQHIQRISDTKTRKEEMISNMLSLRYEKLMDNKQISIICGVDERTINKLIGLTPKFVTIGQVDKKHAVYYYYLEHKSNQQIASILNISCRMVRKYKNQLRDEGYDIKM